MSNKKPVITRRRGDIQSLSKVNMDIGINEVLLTEICAFEQHRTEESMVKEKIEDLAININQHGVMQPIALRSPRPDEVVPDGVRYIIIFGERRFRASKLAGKKSIPAKVFEVDQKEADLMQADENLQQESLTFYEKLRVINNLSAHFSTEELLEKLPGKIDNFPEYKNTSSILRLKSIYKYWDVVQAYDKCETQFYNTVEIAKLAKKSRVRARELATALNAWEKKGKTVPRDYLSAMSKADRIKTVSAWTKSQRTPKSKTEKTKSQGVAGVVINVVFNNQDGVIVFSKPKESDKECWVLLEGSETPILLDVSTLEVNSIKYD